MTDRIVVLDDFIDLGTLRETLGAAGIDVGVEFSSEIPSGAGIIALLVGPETVGLDAHHLDSLPDLRLLAATSAGFDHLPVGRDDRGVAVTRAVDYCTEEVADHALASILSLLRSIGPLDAAVHQGRWSVVEYPPRRIAGTVLGLGSIQALASRAAALGMTVLAAGRSLSAGAPGVEVVEWDELLRRSDVLSVHVPLTAETAGIVDAQALASMKPGSFLVNVSRGGLVDHEALGSALRSGRLAGAAVDVLPTEPPTADDPILQIPNLTITPHAAWYSSAVSGTRQSALNVVAVLTESPRWAL
ncbi:D-2-hydroxyacid dehydrogenase [Rhodococcus baikonurensis]